MINLEIGKVSGKVSPPLPPPPVSKEDLLLHYPSIPLFKIFRSSSREVIKINYVSIYSLCNLSYINENFFLYYQMMLVSNQVI